MFFRTTMKQTFLFVLVNLLLGLSLRVSSQCIPVNCLDKLPAYGGICDKKVSDGIIGRVYSGVTSFHITSTCVDLGMLDSALTGVGGKMLKLHSFQFSGLPSGLTASTNLNEYSAPANGCGALTGIPREAGLFRVRLAAKVDIRTWLVSSSCSGILYLDAKNQLFDGTFTMLILPDAGFTVADTVYCVQNPPVTLTPTGTPGGTFSGPGVSGNTFDPALAGPGTHMIRYEVSAQQGAAVEPSKNSSSIRIRVADLQTFFADGDGDGFGNPLLSVKNCSGPAGYVTNDLDCNDANASVNPRAVDIPGNGIDEDCSGSDGPPNALPDVLAGHQRWYPNPAEEFLVVESPFTLGNEFISIFSTSGVMMLEQPLSERITRLDIRDFPSGIYLIRISGTEGNNVYKMVKR
jgi:hypothetical protein